MSLGRLGSGCPGALQVRSSAARHFCGKQNSGICLREVENWPVQPGGDGKRGRAWLVGMSRLVRLFNNML